MIKWGSGFVQTERLLDEVSEVTERIGKEKEGLGGWTHRAGCAENKARGREVARMSFEGKSTQQLDITYEVWPRLVAKSLSMIFSLTADRSLTSLEHHDCQFEVRPNNYTSSLQARRASMRVLIKA